MTRPWTPLARPDQAEAIEPFLGEIARALWEAREDLDPSLASGLAGAALFLGHLGLRPGWEEQRERAQALLGMAIRRLDHGAPRFFGGYPGLAWAVEHLRRHALPPLEGDPNREVDALLLEALGAWEGGHDLVGGLVGLGVYALERPPAAGGPILVRVLDHLEALALDTGEGLTWPTNTPPGPVDLGLAHGVPGVLALVAALRARGLEVPRCDRLLAGGMADLQARFQDPARGTLLGGRVAWCYGDLGASLALAQVASATGRWGALALAMARLAAARPAALCGVRDAGLCHGSAGNAHLFNRWFQATGEAPFREAARRHLDQTLAFRAPGGFAGVLAFQPDPGSPELKPAAGLLQGAAGVGLALLSALGGDPAWDRFMLVSSPPLGDPR